MRSLEEIRADFALTEDKDYTNLPSLSDVVEAECRLVQDIPDLLAALEAKDAEIEQLLNEINATADFHNLRARETWVDRAHEQRRIDDLRTANTQLKARQYREVQG